MTATKTQAELLQAADAKRTRPLSSTVRAAREAAEAVFSAEQIARYTQGRDFSDLTADELKTVIRDAIAVRQSA